MTFIEPSAEIIATNSDHPLQFIEQCARTCYQSQDKITDGSAERMVKMLVSKGHLAMIEHLVITMRLITSRGVSHELVRHRVASYAERSTRYCDSKDMHICTPAWCRNSKFNMNNLSSIGDEHTTRMLSCYLFEDGIDIKLSDRIAYYIFYIKQIEKYYNDLLERGATKQEARGILPNDLATEIIITANAREWMHILELRTAPDAHPDMQLIMKYAKQELNKYCPELFK